MSRPLTPLIRIPGSTAGASPFGRGCRGRGGFTGSIILGGRGIVEISCIGQRRQVVARRRRRRRRCKCERWRLVVSGAASGWAGLGWAVNTEMCLCVCRDGRLFPLGLGFLRCRNTELPCHSVVFCVETSTLLVGCSAVGYVVDAVDVGRGAETACPLLLVGEEMERGTRNHRLSIGHEAQGAVAAAVRALISFCGCCLGFCAETGRFGLAFRGGWRRDFCCIEGRVAMSLSIVLVHREAAW